MEWIIGMIVLVWLCEFVTVWFCLYLTVQISVELKCSQLNLFICITINFTSISGTKLFLYLKMKNFIENKLLAIPLALLKGPYVSVLRGTFRVLPLLWSKSFLKYFLNFFNLRSFRPKLPKRIFLVLDDGF